MSRRVIRPLGAVQAASLAVSAIGKSMACARGADFDPKHAVKQVDRLLSNEGVDLWSLFGKWIPFCLGERKEALITLEWTAFARDDHTTLASLATKHGRTTPLMWLTQVKSALKGNRSFTEDLVLQRLREVIPADVNVTILADRGFADAKLYALLAQLGFHHVIRFRGDTLVQSEKGETKTAAEWLPEGGKAKLLRRAKVTKSMQPVAAIVCVQRKEMKEAWYLSASYDAATAQEIIDTYGRRFTCEEMFRDMKDLRFGMGMSSLRIASTDRRDRLLLISAFTQALLTLLGAAGESLGYDRRLKANTVKRRTHSLFTQGAFYFQWMLTMSEARLQPLVERFGQLIREQYVFREAFGLI